MLSQGSLLDTYAGRLSFGSSFFGGVLDISLHYRASYSRYEADLEGWWGHTVGGHFLVRPIPDLSFSLQTDGIIGRDLDAVLIQLLATWGPAF